MGLAVGAWAPRRGRPQPPRRDRGGGPARHGDEQARIARELHDVIAHSVSMIVVQAAAADDVFDERPDQAREALRSIERAGRDALRELRRLLSAVRPGIAADPTEPQPGLDRLDELASALRAGGLQVAVRREGQPAALPAGLDLSAYRIVQEALTNTLRHARATRADVTLSYGAGRARAGRPRRRPRAARQRQPAATGWSACASAPPCSAARSRPARIPAAATASTRGSPLMSVKVVIADDQALVRGGFRMILDAQGGHRGRRRGQRRRRGDRARRRARAGRGADGRAHAEHRRHRGHAPDRRVRQPRPHHHPHDARRGRVRLRRPARRRQRLPAQGRAAARAGRGHPGRRPRRRPARRQRHPPAARPLRQRPPRHTRSPPTSTS